MIKLLFKLPPFFTLLFSHYLLLAQIPESTLLFDGKDDYIRIADAPSLNPSKQFTVECWIKPNDINWNNKPQYLLSKTNYKDFSHFKNFDNWHLYNASNQSGANDVHGFVGAVFDGRYVYFSPWLKSNFPEAHSGQVLRYDTYGNYQDSLSWDVYDASDEDNLGDIRGLEGAVFDGTYIYFVPLHQENNYFGKILRYDTRKDFKDSASWDVYNAENEDGQNAVKGFVGAVYDGQYIYFVPNSFAPHGKVLRFDTKADFSNTQSWDVFNIHTLSGSQDVTGFFGAVFDGKYIYFIPLYSEGKFVRLDAKNDFSNPASWEIYDARQLFSDAPVVPSLNFTGGAFDGRYMYFSQYYGGKILRYDTHNDFLSNQSWKIQEVVSLGSSGGIGPVYNGRYIYFPPMVGADYGTSGKIVGYDTHMDFNDNAAWDVVDIFDKDNQFLGFEGAVFDGSQVYFSPMNFGDPHGKILRYNALDLSYALVYNQTSSSFGSVLQRPTFKIGTSSGLRTVSLSKDYNLSDGQWHHLVATYDGKTAKIYLDGRLENTADYATSADCMINNADLTIGGELGAKNCFAGSISMVSLYPIALSEEVILQNYSKNQPAASLAVSHFPIDEGKGVITMDSGEDKNTGYLINEPIWYLKNPTLVVGNDSVYCQPNKLNYVSLAWAKVKAAELYHVQVGREPDFTDIIYDNASIADTSLQISHLQNAEKYYWRVKATNQSNDSDWSAAYFRLNITSEVTSQVSIQTSGDILLCEGDSITLTAIHNGEEVNFVWQIDEQPTVAINNKTLVVKQSGTYKVSAIYNSGCIVTSPPIKVNVFPLPQPPVISLSGVDSLVANIESQEYIWKLNGQLLNENSKKIRAIAEGEYSVSVKGLNECYSSFSTNYTFARIDVANQIMVYPNPNQGSFTIIFADLPGIAHITLAETNGRVLLSEQILISNDYYGRKEDFSNYKKGLYVLTVKSGNKIFHKKIIVH